MRISDLWRFRVNDLVGRCVRLRQRSSRSRLPHFISKWSCVSARVSVYPFMIGTLCMWGCVCRYPSFSRVFSGILITQSGRVSPLSGAAVVASSYWPEGSARPLAVFGQTVAEVKPRFLIRRCPVHRWTESFGIPGQTWLAGVHSVKTSPDRIHNYGLISLRRPSPATLLQP